MGHSKLLSHKKQKLLLTFMEVNTEVIIDTICDTAWEVDITMNVGSVSCKSVIVCTFVQIAT